MSQHVRARSTTGTTRTRRIPESDIRGGICRKRCSGAGTGSWRGARRDRFGEPEIEASQEYAGVTRMVSTTTTPSTIPAALILRKIPLMFAGTAIPLPSPNRHFHDAVAGQARGRNGTRW